MTLQQELMAKWLPLIRRSSHVWTYTGDGELAFLAEQATKAKTAIELGVHFGKSSKVMLDANPELHLWAVDAGFVDGMFETSSYFLREEIAAGRCEMIRKTTKEAAEQLAHLKGTIDLCWIDASHSFEDVYLDIKLYAPLLKVGGLLCGHDLDQNPDNDVTKAVRHCLFNWWSEPVHRVWSFTKTREPVW